MYLMQRTPWVLRLALASAAFVVCSSAMGETFVARVTPKAGKITPPAEILGTAPVGERFCNKIQCVLFTTAPSEKAALQAFQDRGQLMLELRADLRKIPFRNATYDGDLQAFDREFPGSAEFAGPGEPAGLYALLFKSFPQEEWLDGVSKAGLTLIQP